MMDAHQINPQKAGKAAADFALAVTPPKPTQAQTGQKGRKDSVSFKAGPTKGGCR